MAIILVVEDNPANMTLVCELLEEEGYTLLQASDGALGLSMVNSEMPDLVLMDVSLPLLSGLEATTILKRDSRTRDIPIIALTAHAMAGDRERCIAAGCNDYDTKPIQAARLLGKISTLLLARSPDFVQRLQLLRGRLAPPITIGAVQKELEAAKEERDRARYELRSAGTSLSRAQDQLRENSAELLRLESELKQSLDALSRAEAERDEARQLAAALTGRLRSAQEREAELTALVHQHEQDALAQEKELSAQKEAQKEVQKEVRLDESLRLKAERRGVSEKRLQEAQRQAEEMRERLRLSEDRCRIIEEQLRAIPPDVALMRMELERLRQHAGRLQSALHTLQSAVRSAVDSSFRELMQAQIGEPRL